MTAAATSQPFYRLPWSFSDNGSAWLTLTHSPLSRPTSSQNHRITRKYKTLYEVSEDLVVFKRKRNIDTLIIAGEDPLDHPRIIEIVRMVARNGWKPVIHTSGASLTPMLLRDLKRARIHGFDFQIDSSQIREDTRARDEVALNELRRRFAEMIHTQGGLHCAFTQIVTSETLDSIPHIVRWAQTYPDLVHSYTFILYRAASLYGRFDFRFGQTSVTGPSILMQPLPIWGGDRHLQLTEAFEKIIEADPEFRGCAMIGGSENRSRIKWIVAARIANRDESFGYVSPGFMRLAQWGHHLVTGRWLSHPDRSSLAKGRALSYASALVDKGMRKVARRQLLHDLRNPLGIFRKSFVQTFTIMQPMDILPDGKANMCDGCPEMIAHEGRLYPRCRLEEARHYGRLLTAVPLPEESQSEAS